MVIAPTLLASLGLHVHPCLPQEPLVPADAGSWPAAVSALVARERDGSELRVAGGHLTRTRAGRTQTLGCTRAGGTGAIRALAAHRDGTTYVAAEHGVFVLHQDVEHLDPLDLLAGLPTGSPVGLAIDARGRVWVATERELSCVRPEWISGCLWPAPLPGLPLRAIAGDGGGDLWLRTDHGTFRYRPHMGPPPVLRATLAGHTAPARAVAPGGTLSLQLSGGVAWRYRKGGHHVWYPVAAEATVSGLHPGHHLLEFVALDRDANASLPLRIEVDVPYPPALDRRLLVGAVAAVALAALAAFVWRARAQVRARLLPPGLAFRLAGTSALLLVLLVLLVLGSVLGYGRSWPFLGYSMYTQRYHEGSALFIPVTMGIRPDGSMVEIDSSLTGEHFYGPWEHVVPLIQGGDEACRRFLSQWQAQNPGIVLRGVQVRADRFRLTGSGPRVVAPLVLHHYEPGP